MTFAHAIVLGIVQGLTEPLPVSSSGHLVLVPAVLGWRPPSVAFDVLLHGGTLLAILVSFRTDLGELLGGAGRHVMRRTLSADDALRAEHDFRQCLFILAGTVPAAVVGWRLGDRIESVFLDPPAVAWFLIGTAMLLWVAVFLQRRLAPRKTVGLLDALFIGVCQATALLPGMSRSGATISAGMARGLGPEKAARFSFLLGIPAMAGAVALKVIHLLGAKSPPGAASPMLLGAAVAAGIAYLALVGLFGAVRRGGLHWFGVYCGLAGLAVLIASLTGHLPA
jgi:undecaprenyl-diphosphatase